MREKKILCQQCNCQGVYGAGLSGAISKAYPIVKEKYEKCYKKNGSDKMFGKYQVIRVDKNLAVANIFSQYGYGNSGKTGEVYTDVEKLVKCIRAIATTHKDCEILIPIGMGCGLAGADWNYVSRSIINLAVNLELNNIGFIDTKKYIDIKPKDGAFRVMKNVVDNRELKHIHSNLVLNVRTRNTEDLLDINRQIWRLEKEGYKVILQSPKGKLLPARALGKYTREHVNIEIGGLNKVQIEAKFANLKSMMSHKEYVGIPMYETSYPSAFNYKTPKTDGDGNRIGEIVEKTVYLNRQYTITVNGEYCHTKAVKKLAKSFKIPLATVIGNEVIDQNDESYLLDGYNDKSKEILNRKYEELSDNKKEILYEVFGIKEYKVSDYENYLYSTHNFVYFLKGELGLPRPVDAQKLLNVLETFKVDNAYDFLYDQAERGMLTHLEDFPLIQLLLDKWETETDVFYEDSYIKEDEDPLD